MTARGFSPLGMEPVAVGVSSDADHIITPSIEGPTAAMRQAFAEAGVRPGRDRHLGPPRHRHAGRLPGGRDPARDPARTRCWSPRARAPSATACRAGGGWELTAQYLGYERGRLFPAPFTADELNPAIAGLHDRFVFDRGAEPARGPAGKLSMGVGGINACVLSRPW